MRSTRRYTLWFVNESLLGGQACVYQDPANAPCNQHRVEQLAWRLAPANPQVDLRFEWEAAYQCVWFDQDNVVSARQFYSADPHAGSALVLERNRYGCEFQALPERATRGQLAMLADRSIEAGGPVCLGIGMDGGASFSAPASPNVITAFTPVPESQLVYWISFGAYGLQPNGVIDTAMLNPSARISFPPNVDTMTAVLDQQNEWHVSAGGPARRGSAGARQR
jgi:hypothetical protein